MTTHKILIKIIVITMIFAMPFPLWAVMQKEWTIAVFFNGDNDLDEFVEGDQIELARVGSKSWMNIVTLTDHFKSPATINSIGESGEIKQVINCGEIDMGDYRQLVKFMEFVTSNFPAKKYCLIIWNHGSGWKDGRRPVYKGISYDQTSGNEISNSDLQKALKEIKGIIGHNIEILGMDACFMQMVEVAFVCKDSCNYIVASEEEAPGMGIPFDQVFSALARDSSTEEFVKSWVKAYVGSYSGGSQGTKVATQSAIRCSNFPRFLDALDGFAKACMASGFNEHFSDSLKKVQRFLGQQNIDILHFVNLIKNSDNDSSMQTACGKFFAAYESTVIAAENTGDAVQNALGLAIYFPWDFHFDSAYDKIPFCGSALWGEMIHDYYKKESARTILHSLERNDLAPLEKYSMEMKSGGIQNKYVLPLVNFRLYCETGISEDIKTRVNDLLSEDN